MKYYTELKKTISICLSLDKSDRHYVEQKEPEPEEYILYHSIYMKQEQVKLIDDYRNQSSG